MLKSELEGVRASCHYDEHGDEWVVRVHSPSGIFSLCGCPGEMEAKVVCKLIAAVVSLADTTFMEISGDGPDYVRMDNMVEYDSMKADGADAIDSLKEFAEA